VSGLRLAVFDCDGTLVDGQAEICSAMGQAFAGLGLAVPPRHAILSTVGLSLHPAMRRLLPDAEPDLHEALASAYKQAFRAAREAGRVHEPLFDGIAALVADLAKAGWLLGVATGKSQRGLTACLAMHGLSHHFTTLQTADNHPSKPHPAMLEAAMAECGAAPHETVMIGDTAYDMAMARAVDVRALGVAWGYHSTAELEAAGAHGVAHSCAHLKDLLG
jgi:phosphoglycolate phosphatase